MSITVDNGTVFGSRAMGAWAYQFGVQLDFIRPANRWRTFTSSLLTDGCAMNA